MVTDLLTASAVLKEKGIDEPTSVQLNKAIDAFDEEHHAILFL